MKKKKQRTGTKNEARRLRSLTLQVSHAVLAVLEYTPRAISQLVKLQWYTFDKLNSPLFT